MSRGGAGFAMVEVLVASLVASVVAGGTMMAFVAAARMMRTQDNPKLAEANNCAAQTIERFRNHVAADDTWLNDQVALGWQADALTDAVSGCGGGTESIQTLGTAKRCYRVSPSPACGPQCYQLDVKVCWGPTACPC